MKTKVSPAGSALMLAVSLVCLAALFVGCSAANPEWLATPIVPKPSVEVPTKPEPAPQGPTFPLTGLPADDVGLTLMRPLSVKIENTGEARPQLGISSADVVYETITEGGITRFNCIFQSTVPSEVGPVRSGRNSDISLVPQYDAFFFMSGANDLVLSEIANAHLADLSYNTASGLYHRVDYRAAPHNLYLDLPESYAVAEQKGFATTLTTPRALEFGDAVGQDLPDAPSVVVPFSDYFVAEWSWSPDDNAYLRSMNGPTYDAEADQRVSASNVVVLWAEYIPILDGQTLGVNLASSGYASLFMGGKRIDGTWESDGTNPPRFKDTNNNPLKLTPGKTWFQVLNVGQGLG